MAEDLHPAYSAMSDEVLTEDPSPFATDKASDITVVICELFQQNVVSLKLHKDVLNKSEYFRQRFDADQDVSELSFYYQSEDQSCHTVSSKKLR